ncbi:MAG: rhodanese-like domain-containing protein [Cyclobacteriaceae bacterium]|nr:rhodanese-like domain-containing protein [Cyclobacteriaceae bacterium]
MKKIINTLIVVFGALNLQCQPTDFDEKLKSLYKGTVPLIHQDDLNQLIDNNKSIIILDTRTSEEFKISAIKEAKFIDYDNFKPTDVKSIDKTDTIVVYCSVGYRSERIGEKLQKLGYKHVLNLYGGIFDWVNSGNFVYKNNSTITDSVHTYNENWGQWLIKGVKVYD